MLRIIATAQSPLACSNMPNREPHKGGRVFRSSLAPTRRAAAAPARRDSGFLDASLAGCSPPMILRWRLKSRCEYQLPADSVPENRSLIEPTRPTIMMSVNTIDGSGMFRDQGQIMRRPPYSPMRLSARFQRGRRYWVRIDPGTVRRRIQSQDKGRTQLIFPAENALRGSRRRSRGNSLICGTTANPMEMPEYKCAVRSVQKQSRYVPELGGLMGSSPSPIRITAGPARERESPRIESTLRRHSRRMSRRAHVSPRRLAVEFNPMLAVRVQDRRKFP